MFLLFARGNVGEYHDGGEEEGCGDYAGGDDATLDHSGFMWEWLLYVLFVFV